MGVGERTRAATTQSLPSFVVMTNGQDQGIVSSFSVSPPSQILAPKSRTLAQRRSQDTKLVAVLGDGAAGDIEAARTQHFDQFLIGEWALLIGDQFV